MADADFATAADTETPQGVLAIAAIPARTWEVVPSVDPLRVLVLDAVQDPGNVGTMLRTAAALGVAATVSLAGTVDLWNAKVVRSAMGAHFTHSGICHHVAGTRHVAAAPLRGPVGRGWRGMSADARPAGCLRGWL